jgi:intracellular multiplication protein IcmL
MSNTKPTKTPVPPAKARKATSEIGAGSMAHRDEAVATHIARNAFARERYEFLLKTNFVTLAFLALSLVVNVFYGMRETRMEFFAVSPDGRVTPIQALDRPVQSIAQVRNWATDALLSSLTLSFANYRKEMNEYQLNFTDQGWRSYQEALKGSNIIDTIISQQLVTSAVASGAPVLKSRGIADNGKWGWQLEIPVVVTYESTSQKQQANYLIQMTVVRRPESENPSGLGIAQILLRT